MITLSPWPVYCFAILLSLNVVAGFFNCNSDNCRDCASNTDAFGITCRWCRRDNECHTPGAFLTNPCKRAENIVDPSRCGEKFSRYDPELSLKMLLLSHSCMGASLLIPSLLVNCTLSSLAKSPNQCCKLSLKSPEGSG